jgi:NAD+ synthase (glutamine-hydrolysing)
MKKESLWLLRADALWPDTRYRVHFTTMLVQLSAKLAEIRAARGFKAETWVARKIEMLNHYMTRAGLSACVVNVSGGIDSAVTIRLAQLASQVEGSPIKRVLGILQPIHSTASIQDRAADLCKALNIECIRVDQTPVYDTLYPIVEGALGLSDVPAFARGQLRSYMRTPVAYYTCQLLAVAGTPGIVLGTGNFDEDGYLFYFCKPGDGTTDVQLIHDCHKSEVRAVARQIGVIQSIIDAPPSADLWEGQTDEDELGFPYDFVELYTELVTHDAARDAFVATLDPENKAQWDKWAQDIRQVNQRNGHKAYWPVNLDICVPIGTNYSFD